MNRFQVLLSIITLHLFNKDFVQKVISQMNVSDSMTALQKARQQDAIVVTASHAHCDGRKISASFKQAVASSGKKRAAVIKTSDCEQRRAWWNLLYW
jgi:hypothetical protein